MHGEPTSVERGFRAVHEDPWIVVLDKDAGLLTVPGIGTDKADCLASRAAIAFPGARIVHRLDRDTSGLIVLARDAESHRHFSRQFEVRAVTKRYAAIVSGIPATTQGTIDLPIAKDLMRPPRQRIDREFGRPSITEWTLVEALENPPRARLALHPVTGRSHQLRLHLLEIGHPILGDDLYAPESVRAMAPRLCLHAEHLAFAHPSTRERMAFDCAAPF
jgi:tRNA pseudouridine32 synthase/23S rRNA pseudouridine746 synthase